MSQLSYRSSTATAPGLSERNFRIKRVFDLACAAALLLVASPLYLFIALIIRLDSRGPIFYRQVRVGFDNRRFQMWKFRTMVVDAEKLQAELERFNQSKDGVMFKIKDDPRITRVGRFLRQYSLDELPQLFNVLSGEMSLVGPRPLPLRDVERFEEHHFQRHAVLPGITGIWQVSGRSEVTDFDEVLEMDLLYIENWSLRMDLEILVRTIGVVFLGKGAY
jgi:exopolysaccharide biosynthesis polyprenyl glycosylphosphotransferase